VLALARRKNAVIKVSGACTLLHKPYPFADIWDPLARVFDAWGFERLPVGHRLDPRLRGRQLRAGRRAVSPDRAPLGERTRDADGRGLRQGVRLVAEETGMTD